MSYQPQTEAATSRFPQCQRGGRTLRIHINDCGDGERDCGHAARIRAGGHRLGQLQP